MDFKPLMEDFLKRVKEIAQESEKVASGKQKGKKKGTVAEEKKQLPADPTPPESRPIELKVKNGSPVLELTYGGDTPKEEGSDENQQSDANAVQAGTNQE